MTCFRCYISERAEYIVVSDFIDFGLERSLIFYDGNISGIDLSTAPSKSILRENSIAN
jgi:hypothetical protein